MRTFSKLADEIIAKFSGEKKPADDITKNIIMYRAVSEIRDSLEAFGRVATKAGFAPKMTATVAMLKGAGISAAKFCDTMDAVKEDFRDSSPALFNKLSDVAKIYSAYDALLTASYSDRLDSTAAAAKLAAENGAFKGQNVYVDGFSDFSQSQLDFLFSIIDLAENVTFSFVTENGEGCRDIFTTVNGCANLLAAHSKSADKEVCGLDEIIEENSRFRSPALAQLSERLYTGGKADCDPCGLRIIRADDVYAEADFIAAEIRRLVTEEGLRYNEIAVLTPSPAEYRTPIESAFEKYEIPLFCDMPESILHTPLANLVLALLGMLKSFTVESVLSYIKSGFIQKSDGKPLTMRDINDLEDYIYEWDLKPENLKEPFPEIGGKTPRAEKIRAEIIPPVLELKARLDGLTGDLITKEICDFLFDVVGVQRAVAAHCKAAGSELLTDSDKGMIAGYQTLWNKLLEIFEGLYNGLSGYKISLADYYSLVRDICAGATLASPPQTLDCVLTGDTERTRLSGARAVFIIGANYGMFPKESSDSGIFSEYEAELLSDSIMKIGMNRKERYCYNRYLAYRALCAPTEKLYISYPLLSAGCEKLAASDIIAQVEEIFGKKLTENAAGFGDEFYCRSLKAAQQRFATVCSDTSVRRETLKSALTKAGSGEFAERLEQLATSRSTAFKHSLSPETAEALFRSNTFSATRLEKLNQCRFQYFCNQGLRVTEKKRRNLSSMEIGNAVHYVLQKVLEKYCDEMEQFIRLSREQLSDEARHFLDEYKNAELGGDYAKNLRFSYMYKNLTIGAVDILILLQAEFAARDYRPKFFELKIGGEGAATSPSVKAGAALSPADLPDTSLTEGIAAAAQQTEQSFATSDNIAGSSRTTINTPALNVRIRENLTINITGVIDRADIFTDRNGNEYIRVVDYKTGSREFSMVNVYYGINTQMLLYLIAVCDANSDLKAGGVSYLPARVTEPVEKRTAAFSLLSSDHVQSGMYVAHEAAEAEMLKYAENIAAKAGMKREKFLPKLENTLSAEEFEKLKQSCLSQTAEVVSRLYSGDVNAVPTVYKEKYTEKKACSYCRFESICGHNENAELHAVPQTDSEKEGEADELDG